VEGKGTHLNSQPLRDFLFGMMDSGFRHFEIDLANCTYMDSTFIGTLVGVGLRIRKICLAKLSIRRLSPRNRELLQTLGVEQFFDIDTDSQSPLADETQLRVLPAGLASKLERAETMLEAHQTLAGANQSNEPRFKDCIQFLKEDLVRMKAQNKTSSAPSEKS
jgi:anti-anti-sigma regulatory factor